MCLHIEGQNDNTHNGATIHLWTQIAHTHADHLNQEWLVDAEKSEVRSVKAPHKGLHLAGSTENGAKVHLWEESCSDKNHLNQKWAIVPLPNGHVLLRSLKAPEKCLHLCEGAVHRGAKVHLWAESGHTSRNRLNQEWQIHFLDADDTPQEERVRETHQTAVTDAQPAEHTHNAGKNLLRTRFYHDLWLTFLSLYYRLHNIFAYTTKESNEEENRSQDQSSPEASLSHMEAQSNPTVSQTTTCK